MNIEERVIDLIAQVAAVKRSEIAPADRLREDLGMDSVSSMELLSLLAEELDLDVGVEEAMGILTVQAALDMARRHAETH